MKQLLAGQGKLTCASTATATNVSL